MMQPTLSVEVVPGKHARLHTKTNVLTVQLSDPDKENCTSKKKKWPIAVQLASSGRKAVCISVVHADTGERVEHCTLVHATSGDPFGSVFLFDEPSMRRIGCRSSKCALCPFVVQPNKDVIAKLGCGPFTYQWVHRPCAMQHLVTLGLL